MNFNCVYIENTTMCSTIRHIVYIYFRSMVNSNCAYVCVTMCTSICHNVYIYFRSMKNSNRLVCKLLQVPHLTKSLRLFQEWGRTTRMQPVSVPPTPSPHPVASTILKSESSVREETGE